MRESDIEAYLGRRVQALGGRSFKWTSPANRGVPDRIVFVNGQIWFIELKTPTGRLTELQKYIGKFIQEYTDNYIVINSKEAVDEWVTHLSKP